MDNEKEISFGAFDSELMHQEIFIPEGFTATIDGDKIILKKKESEDERIRKIILDQMKCWNEEATKENCEIDIEASSKCIAWLEKQGEHANFRNKIQIGDKVTRNKDGVLVNLSQLNRVAKKDEKQREQKPADKVEPKFHKGEWITNGIDFTFQIHSIEDNMYLRSDDYFIDIETADKKFRLWTIQDAKDGDVLCYKDEISLYKHDIKNCTKQETTFGGFVYHCCYDGKRFITDSLYSLTEQDKMDIHPATKEQRGLLFKKMKEEGYEWDDDKKVLIKKIEEKNLTDFENAMMHIGESFFGKNAGLEPNDTNTIKEQAKLLLELTNTHKWSEDDEKLTNRIEGWLDTLCDYLKDNSPEYIEDVKNTIEQLKSLKYRYAWTPSDEQIRALEYIINNAHNTSYSCKIAKELLEQLKKLKGE